MIKELRLMIWFILGLLLGGYAAIARADYQANYSVGGYSSCSALCAADAANPAWGGGATCSVTTNNPPTCTYNVVKNGTNYPRSYTGVYSCPSGGTLSGTTCVINPCQQGAASSATWWNGCFDVDGLDNGCDAGIRLPYPNTGVCNGECVVSISNWTACQMPVGGGPITCTGSGTLTGTQCAPGDNYIPSSSMKCPTGYSIGTVNGKPGCYKSGSDNPVQTTTTQSTDPQTGNVTTTTTTTNTTTNTTTTTTSVYNPTTGTTTTQQQNTPTDPNKPMTDPTKKAPGENQEPFEIDETGTPSDGSLSQAKSEFETAANAHKTFIDGLANQGNHGMTWDWTFELPSGTCSAYTFMIAGKSFTLDPCEKLGMVRDALGFLIYITTALALLSIATGYGKEGK